MATTTNYGWTTPDDTALVKDGASAIRALGTAIDTSMNTALGTKKSGLVLLNTTSFSAVASQSINDVFSSTYDNYKIVLTTVNSTSPELFFRYRVSGADDSTTNYVWQHFFSASTTNTGARTTGTTSFKIGYAGANLSAYEITLYNPFASAKKSGFAAGTYSSTSTTIEMHNTSWIFNTTTSFTGFTIFSTNTNTGTVSTYGINK